jgi:hypothetical protein
LRSSSQTTVGSEPKKKKARAGAVTIRFGGKRQPTRGSMQDDPLAIRLYCTSTTLREPAGGWMDLGKT